MKVLKSRLILIVGLATTFSGAIGCGKKIEVSEVSVAQSGVTVTDQDLSSLRSAWPQWRGPDGDGVAVDQPLPTTWDSESNILWQQPIPGRGHGSPIVVGGKVVVATADDESEQQMVVAHDLDSGEQIWRTVIHSGNFPSRREVHQKATNANGTVASNGKILVTTHLNDERIVATALDLDGTEIWQSDLGDFSSRFGYAPSPVFYKSLIIVAADHDGGDGGFLVALDSATGDVAWRRKRGAFNSYSSPHVANIGGVDQLLLTGGGEMTSYNPNDGEVRWQTQCMTESTCGTVVTADDRVFASGGFPDNETVCVDAEGKIVWSNRERVYEPSMVTDGEFLYTVDDDGIAYCWSIDDGTERWKKRLGGRFSGSPVLCNGLIYVADLSGKCFVFGASGEAYQSVSINKLGDDCYASPAVVDRSLLFRIGFGDGEERIEKLVRIGERGVDQAQ